MDYTPLIERMTESVGDVPTTAEVLALRQYSLEEMERRAKRLLDTIAEASDVSLDRADWVQQADRTLVRLSMGGRAVIYHASGAMKVVMSLNPMESLFTEIEARESLVELIEATAERLRVAEWVGHRDSLSFERLWQIKASAADQERKPLEPILCRVVGAYRHSVGELPVLGPASVAIKLAGGGSLDSVSMHVRDTTGEPIASVPVVRPEEAARHVLLQLDSLMGERSEVPFTEHAIPHWMRFGYVSLPKRKSQRVLAPHYIAAIGITGQEEAQAYQFIVPATEKIYLPLSQAGSHPPPVQKSRTG
jgi:hypothetical protein